jgi:hypothetical protein
MEEGTEPDYSLASLGGLEQILVRLRRPANEPLALEPDELARFRARAAAYAAEVLLRAVPGADVSLKGSDLVLTLPSEVYPGLTLEAFPLLRVVAVLRGEEALLDWAVFLLVMTVKAPANPSPDRHLVSTWRRYCGARLRRSSSPWPTASWW